MEIEREVHLQSYRQQDRDRERDCLVFTSQETCLSALQTVHALSKDIHQSQPNHGFPEVNPCERESQR